MDWDESCYTDYELQHHLKASKARLIIAQPSLYDGILSAARSCGIPESNVLELDSLSQGNFSSTSWRTLLRHGEQDWVRFDDKSVAQSTPACILFSSGTTGLPKAACLSHHNLVAQHTLLQEQVQKPYRVKRILCLPFFHAAMAIIGHITPLRSGHIAYVMPRFQLEDFLRFTEIYEVTELFVVPPIIVSILQSPLVRKYSLRSLRSGMTGGAKIDLLSQQRFTALMHPEGCINPCYGMTEISCIGAHHPWPEVDSDGSEVRAYNKAGEILICGPTVIKGYLDNPEANSLSFSGDWFHTGDVAYCDEMTKKWYIVDRKKELIKVRGFQVAPPELEGVLMSHPLICDAAVIGVPSPNPVDGELPRAYIVRQSGQDAEALDEEKVKQYIAERLAKYKQLAGGIVFVEALPKTASGKYLKRHLRDLYKRETSQSTTKL
ncbi:AMP-binding enzyme domain-containing protein [Cladophialophora immunda]|nr:AMP-binding enzyme domain-containing protein [Cladophialophora immunda]